METRQSLDLTVGKLLVGNGRVLENVKIGIIDGLVREVAEELKESYKESYDLLDKVIMPGLIDAHVHVRYGPKFDSEEKSDEYQAIRGVENAKKALFAGVTTLADAGGIRNVAFAVRNAINDGVTLGPRMFVSGEMITMTGGRSLEPGNRMEVDGPDSARRAARSLLMFHGADFLKLGATGAISSSHTGPRHPQLTVEEMQAVVEEAHKCGVNVHAHCYGETGISNSLKAGVDVIVHGQSLSDEHIRIIKERKVTFLPTLKTFCGHIEHLSEGGIHDRIIETGMWEETDPNFRKALKNDVTIAMGTDAGMPDNLFGENPKDLEYMVDWGMTNSQAIQAATINAAHTINKEDFIGTLEPGKYADLLVLSENPLEDIRNIQHNLEKIMLNGQFI